MKKIIADGVEYRQEKNIVHFILADDERPEWSKALENFLVSSKTNLQMKMRYQKQAELMESDEKRKRFGDFVSNVRGVKVDLASGPSGYFGYIIDKLEEGDVFVATDACPGIVSAHAEACDKENFFVCDMDLDKPLPFRDESVDTFRAYCESVGFTYIGGDITKTIHGKLDPNDLYPLEENECCEERTLYFEKSVPIDNQNV